MYIKRHVHDSIKAHISQKEYTIITGARQTGKTTLLRELYREIKDERRKVYYISLENVEILTEINKHPENVFRFMERPGNPLESGLTETIYLLIDEIQYAGDPSGFLKYLYDTYLENLKIIATGSSAFYIDSKFRDSLAGRKMIFQLRTLTFIEYLDFSERYDLSLELKTIRARADYISLKKRELYEFFNHYLVYGGYPAVVLENDPEGKKERLLELRNSYVKRDILESGIKNELEFYNLMALLAEQVGNLVNKNEISNTLGIHRETIEHYLSIMQKRFHIALIRPFYKNLRKELTKMPKVYFHDPGLRNALLNRFIALNDRVDKGLLLENYIYLRLLQQQSDDNVKYWRTADGNEVDFVVSSDYENGQAYEVKFDKKLYKQAKYQKFKNQYPGISLQVISYSDERDDCTALRV